MHLVNERAVEKNPKILCVCFSVLLFVVCVFFVLFFSTGLTCPCDDE